LINGHLTEKVHLADIFSCMAPSGAEISLANNLTYNFIDFFMEKVFGQITFWSNDLSNEMLEK
jgi:hypothetical protein